MKCNFHHHPIFCIIIVRLSEDPMLLLYVSPGMIITEPVVEWSKENLKNLETAYVGEGIHFIQEDQPDKIGKEIAR